jgi:hypothetical protein
MTKYPIKDPSRNPKARYARSLVEEKLAACLVANVRARRLLFAALPIIVSGRMCEW